MRDSIYFKVLRERKEYDRQDKYVFGKNASHRDKYGIEIRKSAFDSLVNQTYLLLQDSVSPAWTLDTCMEMVRIFNSILINRLHGLSDKQDQLRYDNYRIAAEKRVDDIWRIISPELYKHSYPVVYYTSSKYKIFWAYGAGGNYTNDRNSIYSILNPTYKNKKLRMKYY